MKKFILGTSLIALLAIASPALAAFQPSASFGRPGLATEQHLVVRDLEGMRVYEVSSNPQTADERAIYIAWLEAQVWDLNSQLASMPAPVCEDVMAERRSAIGEALASISSRISSFVAR